MTSKDYDLANNESPVGKEWKDTWREKEKDPSKKRETRQEKKNARRQLHKKNRKNAKEKLRNWEDLEPN